MKANPFRLGLLCVALLALASTTRAELLYATDGFRLVQFDSATPNTTTAPVSFTGLQGDETIVGFDLRPSNGLLYGIGSSSRIYVIDPLTGVATQVGASQFSPGLNGNAFGVDFNPFVDRIRVVSDMEQNIRLNPDTGALAGNDSPLTPAGNIVAAAYSNNFVGTATTTLYGIDSASGNLVLIGGLNGTPSPNGGQVTVVGSLSLAASLSSALGFDISGLTGIAYAVLNFLVPGEPNGALPLDGLYTIDLATGDATFVGQIGDGEFDYSGLTAATAVPEPSSVILLGGAALLFGAYRRFRRAQS